MKRLTLALLALVAGAIAAFAGAPEPAPAADEIFAVDLAEAIRDRLPGLLVIDLRSAEAFERDRVLGARADVQALKDIDTLVVYAERQVDQGRLVTLRLQARPRQILRLRGGVQAWNEEVLFPVLRSDASGRQQHEFKTRAELSRYFGGSPRVLAPGEFRDLIRSRRGC